MEIKNVNDWAYNLKLKNKTSILFTKDYDSETEKFTIKAEARFEIEGAFVTPILTMGYDDEEVRNNRWASIDAELGQRVYDKLYNQILEMLGGN